MIPAPIVRLPGADFTPPSRHDWMDDAACRDADPCLWDQDVTPDTSVARAICAGCPVIASCAAAAKEAGASWCVWAATEIWPRWQKRPARAAS